LAIANATELPTVAQKAEITPLQDTSKQDTRGKSECDTTDIKTQHFDGSPGGQKESTPGQWIEGLCDCQHVIQIFL
jgi:hypothetical protein